MEGKYQKKRISEKSNKTTRRILSKDIGKRRKNKKKIPGRVKPHK